MAANGTVYLTGMTNGPSFPIRQAAPPALGNGRCEVVASWERWCYDAFVAAFTPDGRLQFSTFLGGSEDDHAHGIAVNGAGMAYVIGNTLSTDLPTTTGGVQANKDGGADMFIAEVNIGDEPPVAVATPIPSATALPSATSTAIPTAPTAPTAPSVTPIPPTPTTAPTGRPDAQHRVYLPMVRR